MTLPVLFVPGFMSDAQLYMPQIIALSSQFSVQVAPVANGESMDQSARAALAGAPDRFALVGHGLGGMVAMEMLRMAPDRVARLALFDTNCQNEMPNVAAAREPQMVRAQSGRLADVMRDEIKPDHLAPGPYRLEVLQMVQAMAVSLGSGVFQRQSRAMQRRVDQQGTLRRSKLPTLVACGEYDTLYPARRHEFIAHLMPNAVFEAVLGAGHLPTLEQPEAVTNLLRRWLKADPVRPL